MSKKKKPTRDLILNKALELINEKGMEYVGLREIASILGIRVSNITYYFPTKDDLVNHFTLELNQANEAIFTDETDLTVATFLEKLHQAFLNQIKYRGIMLSMVHIITNNKIISSRHKATQVKRNGTLLQYLHLLGDGGYLEAQGDETFERLAETIAIIAKFWISESAISYKDIKLEDQIQFTLALIANTIKPYCTKDAHLEIERYFASF